MAAYWRLNSSALIQWANLVAEAKGAKITNNQKSDPKLRIYYIFTENISSAHNQMQVVAFCKHVLIL